MSEKKIAHLPPLRVDEQMNNEVRGLASAWGKDVSDIQRMAISKLLDEEFNKYLSFPSIFAAREAAIKKSSASSCDTKSTELELKP